jgi:uncharacterized protein
MSLPFAQGQLDAITATCQRHQVTRLLAFGSVLRPDDRPGESDIDLLMEFQPLDAASLCKAHFPLLNDLRQGLACRVDLGMVDAGRNPVSKRTIEASKQEIHAA